MVIYRTTLFHARIVVRCVGHTFWAYAPHPCEVTAKIAVGQGNGARKCVWLRENFSRACPRSFHGQAGNSNYLPSQHVELGESCLQLFTYGVTTQVVSSHRSHRFPQIFIVHHFITCVQKEINLWKSVRSVGDFLRRLGVDSCSS